MTTEKTEETEDVRRKEEGKALQEAISNVIEALESMSEEVNDKLDKLKEEFTQRLDNVKARQQTICDNEQLILSYVEQEFEGLHKKLGYTIEFKAPERKT